MFWLQTQIWQQLNILYASFSDIFGLIRTFSDTCLFFFSRHLSCLKIRHKKCLKRCHWDLKKCLSMVPILCHILSHLYQQRQFIDFYLIKVKDLIAKSNKFKCGLVGFNVTLEQHDSYQRWSCIQNHHQMTTPTLEDGK